MHRRVLLEGGEPHARCPSLRRVPRQPNPRAFRPFRRALLSARGGLFIPFLDPTPPNEGGARKKKHKRALLVASRDACSLIAIQSLSLMITASCVIVRIIPRQSQKPSCRISRRLLVDREHGSCLMPPTHMFAHHRGGQRQPTPGNAQRPSPSPIIPSPRFHTHTPNSHLDLPT